MFLNWEKQVNNEQEDKVRVSNDIIVLNEREQRTLNIMIPLNLKENTLNAEQLTKDSSFLY